MQRFCQLAVWCLFIFFSVSQSAQAGLVLVPYQGEMVEVDDETFTSVIVCDEGYPNPADAAGLILSITCVTTVPEGYIVVGAGETVEDPANPEYTHTRYQVARAPDGLVEDSDPDSEPVPRAAGAGIVPSGRDGDFGPDGYGSCEFVATINNFIRFLVGITGILAVIAFMYAGFIMVSSRGDMAMIQQAKGIFANVLIGFVILLSAFLVVNTIMSMLVGDDDGLVNWNRIDCSYAREAGTAGDFALRGGDQTYDVSDDIGPDVINVDVSFDPTLYNPGTIASDTSGSCTAGGVRDGTACYATGRCGFSVTASTCGRAKSFDSLLEQAAANYRVPVERLRAIMIVESSANPNAQSPVGAVGLMQVMPTTASSFCGLSASELLDVAKNIDCGARYYATQFMRFGSHDLAAAAYNGGPGANSNSSDCPGLLRWQCPFNSGGCCVNNEVTGTSCATNTGYNETRAYVDKVNIAAQCR